MSGTEDDFSALAQQTAEMLQSYHPDQLSDKALLFILNQTNDALASYPATIV